jgi:hypothetical protein
MTAPEPTRNSRKATTWRGLRSNRICKQLLLLAFDPQIVFPFDAERLHDGSLAR